MATNPLDPDAALHGAQPGKFKPGSADPKPAAAAAPPTLFDTEEGLPDLRPQPIGTSPIEDPASLSQVFGASNREAQRDTMNADDQRLLKGWAPIVQALGYDASENPAAFGELDPASTARFGNAGDRLSKLATDAGVGSQLPFTNNRMADRTTQETLFADQIRKRRQLPGQANFLPGIPDTVEGIHKYFLEQERKASDADRATLSRSPGGIGGTAASLAGGAVGTFHDPLNIVALAIPGGGEKSLLQIAARDALINSVLELAQQPIAAHNRHELGQDYTFGEGVSNVISAGIGGAVLGPALHGAGKAGGAAYDKLVEGVFNAMPESVQRRWADKMKVGNVELTDVLHDMNSTELATFARARIGAGNMTPDEKSAANTLERSADVAESSPYQPGPAGDGTHDAGLADSINEILNTRRPQEREISPAADAGARATGPERPPEATSTAPAAASIGRPQAGAAEVQGEAAIAAFKNRVRSHESTNNVNADNPNSSADGLYQFTDDTFRRYYKRIYGQDLGKHPPIHIKRNAEVQEKLMDALTRDNAAKLQAIGEPVTEGNLYLMHFAGEPGARKILKADPATPIERLLSADAIESNKFLKGQSASEVIAWAHKSMGGRATSVRPQSAAGELAAAGEDPMVAQLNGEALALDNQVIGLTRLPDGSPVNLYTRNVASSAIGVDATRFQFKAGGDELGVTDRLRGVKEWDPGLAGRVLLWEDEGGKLWIADGHQRHGLARRISAESGVDVPMDAMVLRSRDGVSAEDARVYAALKNIAEGTGSAVDAAKVLRTGGEHLADRLPPKSALVRDGAALARLSDDAFGAVYNERISPEFAAVIGHALPNEPDKHIGLVDLLLKTDPANRAQAQSIVRQAIAAGFHQSEENGLFDFGPSVASLFAEKAKIQERALARLRKMRLVHNTAAKEADTLEQAGSKIAVEQSQREAQANAEAIAIVDRLAYRAGPVASALDDSARELAGGGKLGSAVDRYVERIRELDLGALDREAPVNAGDRSGLDGSGRGSEPSEEGASLFEEPGDPPKPTLGELERATERFSDPDGAAVKQQADSLEHDLKAALEPSKEAVLHAGGQAPIERVLEGQRGATLPELLDRAAANQAELAKIGPELGELAGAEFVNPGAKTRDRVLAKADAYPDPADLKDLARGGFLVTKRGQGQKILAELEARGFVVHDKGWKPMNGYADRKLIVQFPNGGVAEIQIIPKAISDYKFGEGHKLYELVHNPGSSDAEVEAAVKTMKERYEELLAGTEFEAVGKEARSSASESGVPSVNAERNVATEASRQPAPGTNTDPLLGVSSATTRSSNSKNLMTGASSIALDMGPKVNPGKIAGDRQLVELGAAAPLRAPGEADQLGEIGLSLFDKADQQGLTFLIDEGGERISAADLMAELDADKKAIDALRGCL